MLKTFRFRIYPNIRQWNEIDRENEKCKNSISKWIRFYNSSIYNYCKNWFKFENNKLTLAKIGIVNIRLSREIEGKIKTCSIIKKNDKYYANFSCEVEKNILQKTNQEVGIDLGIKYFIATSNSELVVNPRYLKKSERKLKLNHQIVSRRIKNSNRRNKAVKILAKTYEKITNQRKDFLHKLSNNIINKNDLIAIEDLKIRSILKSKNSSKNLNRNVIDSSWNIFIDMLNYKSQIFGRKLIKVNPFYTSQTCSNCNNISPNKLDLSIRSFKCSYCNYSENRDINAAINILNKARLTI